MTPKTVSDCLKSNNPAIGNIIQFYGSEKGLTLIRAMLVLAIDNLNSYFNITNKMSDQQTIETINLICKNKPHFRMDDFKFCFDRMKMGYYGKTYNRIDGQTLFEALNAYDNERMDEAENLNRIKHEESKKGIQIKPEEINIDGQKKVVEIFKEVLKGVDTEAVKPTTNKELKRGQSDIDYLSQKWMRQFDKLHGKFGTSSLGSKYVRRYGKTLSVSEFLDHKINQYRKLISRK